MNNLIHLGLLWLWLGVWDYETSLELHTLASSLHQLSTSYSQTCWRTLLRHKNASHSEKLFLTFCFSIQWFDFPTFVHLLLHITYWHSHLPRNHFIDFYLQCDCCYCRYYAVTKIVSSEMVFFLFLFHVCAGQTILAAAPSCTGHRTSLSLSHHHDVAAVFLLTPFLLSLFLSMWYRKTNKVTLYLCTARVMHAVKCNGNGIVTKSHQLHTIRMPTDWDEQKGR